MFTGIIEETGIFHKINNNELYIDVNIILSDLKIGDSVAVNGVCLTVTSIKGKQVQFHVSPTTQKHSNFKAGFIKPGQKVNLERALTLNTRIGGHLVSGHVDGIAKIINMTRKGEDNLFEFLIPPQIKSLIINKGSVALDGVSLTICEVFSSSFMVTIIPQTLKETTFSSKKIGDTVHIEADIFARYLDTLIKKGGSYANNSRFNSSFF